MGTNIYIYVEYQENDGQWYEIEQSRVKDDIWEDTYGWIMPDGEFIHPEARYYYAYRVLGGVRGGESLLIKPLTGLPDKEDTSIFDGISLVLDCRKITYYTLDELLPVSFNALHDTDFGQWVREILPRLIPLGIYNKDVRIILGFDTN